MNAGKSKTVKLGKVDFLTDEPFDLAAEVRRLKLRERNLVEEIEAVIVGADTKTTKWIVTKLRAAIEDK